MTDLNINRETEENLKIDLSKNSITEFSLQNNIVENENLIDKKDSDQSKKDLSNNLNNTDQTDIKMPESETCENKDGELLIETSENLKKISEKTKENLINNLFKETNTICVTDETDKTKNNEIYNSDKVEDTTLNDINGRIENSKSKDEIENSKNDKKTNVQKNVSLENLENDVLLENKKNNVLIEKLENNVSLKNTKQNNDTKEIIENNKTESEKSNDSIENNETKNNDNIDNTENDTNKIKKNDTKIDQNTENVLSKDSFSNHEKDSFKNNLNDDLDDSDEFLLETNLEKMPCLQLDEDDVIKDDDKSITSSKFSDLEDNYDFLKNDKFSNEFDIDFDQNFSETSLKESSVKNIEKFHETKISNENNEQTNKTNKNCQDSNKSMEKKIDEISKDFKIIENEKISKENENSKKNSTEKNINNTQIIENDLNNLSSQKNLENNNCKNENRIENLNTSNNNHKCEKKIDENSSTKMLSLENKASENNLSQNLEVDNDDTISEIIEFKNQKKSTIIENNSDDNFENNKNLKVNDINENQTANIFKDDKKMFEISDFLIFKNKVSDKHKENDHVDDEIATRNNNFHTENVETQLSNGLVSINNSKRKIDEESPDNEKMKKSKLELTEINQAEKISNETINSKEVEKESNDSLKKESRLLRAEEIKNFCKLFFKSEFLAENSIQAQSILNACLVEVFDRHSGMSILREKLRRSEENCEKYRKQISHLFKQVSDMNIVIDRLKKEAKNPNRPLIPVKVTRSVGMQVRSFPEVPMSGALKEAVNKPFDPSSVPNNMQNNVQNKSKQLKKLRSLQPKPVQNIVNVESKPPVPTSVKPTPNPSNSLATPVTSIAQNNQKVSQLMVNLQTNQTPTPPTNTSSSPLKSSTSSATIDLTDDDDLNRTVHQNQISLERATLICRTFPNKNSIIQPNSEPNKLLSTLLNGSNQTIVNTNVQTPSNTQLRQIAPAPGQLVTLNIQKHPAPFPKIQNPPVVQGSKLIPPRPKLNIGRSRAGAIKLSWTLPGYNKNLHAEVTSYEIFAYQAGKHQLITSNLWRQIGTVRSLPLPMACTMTRFKLGFEYYFTVRAVDIHQRYGPFASAQCIINTPSHQENNNQD